MTELRNLQATGLTTIGQSLRTAFDLLNLNRLVTGIDNYGQVCSTEEAEKKSGVESVLTRWNMSPHTPLIPCSPSPIPSLTSINHQHTVTHTLSITRWRHKHNSNRVKRQEHLYLISSETLISVTSDFVTVLQTATSRNQT